MYNKSNWESNFLLSAETKLPEPLSMLSLYHLFKALFKDDPHFRVFLFWFYFCKLCASDVSWEVSLQLQERYTFGDSICNQGLPM